MPRFQQITDSATGVTTLVPFTPEEEAQRDAEEAAAVQAAADAEAAKQAAERQRAADLALILGAMPTPESKAALARFLGVPAGAEGG